jgi:hypothetical protein
VLGAWSSMTGPQRPSVGCETFKRWGPVGEILRSIGGMTLEELWDPILSLASCFEM